MRHGVERMERKSQTVKRLPRVKGQRERRLKPRSDICDVGCFSTGVACHLPSTDRRVRAEASLQARNQRSNESVAMYLKDMSRLFRRADPNMSANKKLRHLRRGVKQELFAGLLRSPPRTVAEFHSEATTMKRRLQQRSRMYIRE